MTSAREAKPVEKKRANPAANTTALEREIDQQVYGLYPPSSRSRSASGLRREGGLTPEETCPRIGRRVKIVEFASAKATARQGSAIK
ncbi:MAG: hypothetical protein HY360_13405 [Verrucomicrobia bacterium]|nr:hypothetical protein [Verrucomicrobiota bacterium]